MLKYILKSPIKIDFKLTFSMLTVRAEKPTKVFSTKVMLKRIKFNET